MTELRILFLSQRFLLPMDTGGKIRTGNILIKLSNEHEITLISNVESPKDDQWITEMPDFCSKFIPVKWKEIPKYSFFFFLRLFFQMFSKYPVSVLNDFSAKLQKAVEDELKNNHYDLAICDFVQSALMFKNISDIPTVLFQHNVESMIARRHISQNFNPIAKLFWWLQWKKMYAFEKKACQAFDTVIAVSEKDCCFFRDKFGAVNPVTIPTGVDLDYYRPSDQNELVLNEIVFCGSMDWLPNEDAILFFIDEILPELKKSSQDIHLTVVGRNPSPSLQKIVADVPGITLTGWVEDTRVYIDKCCIFIVPIRIGGGTRMKIYEAMAMKKTVISTTIGAEGLPLENWKHILLEDDPEKFAAKILEYMNDEPKRMNIGEHAREYVEKNFGWQAVSGEFSLICQNTNKKNAIQNRLN